MIQRQKGGDLELRGHIVKAGCGAESISSLIDIKRSGWWREDMQTKLRRSV